MNVLSHSDIVKRRGLLFLLSILCLITLAVVIGMVGFYFVSPSHALEVYTHYLGSMLTFNSPASALIAIAIASASLVLHLVFAWLKTYFQKIMQSDYEQIYRIRKLVPAINEFIEDINALRSYITKGERTFILSEYSKVAKKESSKLQKIDRYPNGEKLSPKLEYV